jgi:hypothetical protein
MMRKTAVGKRELNGEAEEPPDDALEVPGASEAVRLGWVVLHGQAA